MDKIARFMEFFWALVGISTAAWFFYIWNLQGWEVAKSWVWFPVIGLAMWAYRRFTRKRMARWAESRKNG